MYAFLLNLSVAVIWLLLMEEGLVSFFIGFLFGFLLLGLFGRLLGSQDYVRRVGAFVRFVLVFIREFIISNVTIAKAVLFQNRNDLDPNFITLDVKGMNEMEIFLLSQCITLTPGTTTVDLIENGNKLMIHAFDVNDPDEIRESIEHSLKQAILRFTR